MRKNVRTNRWRRTGNLDANVALARRYETQSGVRRVACPRVLGHARRFVAPRRPDGLREVRRDHLHEAALAFGKRIVVEYSVIVPTSDSRVISGTLSAC